MSKTVVKIQITKRGDDIPKALRTVSRCFKGDVRVIRSYVNDYPEHDVYTSEELEDGSKLIVKWVAGVNC